MSKGLEAFNKIKNDSYKTYEEECVCYEIVKRELKAIEIIRQFPHITNIILKEISKYGLHSIENYELLKEVLL